MLLIIAGCTNNKTSERNIAAEQAPKTLPDVKTPVSQPTFETDSFENFYNAEMVEYCVPIPSAFKEDYNAATVKGVHMFFDAKKENVITVMGLLRSDSSVSLSEYFKNTYDTVMEEGKAIEEKQLLQQKNCFYVKGYWNNMYYKARFLEITWLRPSEVVVYKAEMPVTDTAFWYTHLNKLLNSTADCK